MFGPKTRKINCTEPPFRRRGTPLNRIESKWIQKHTRYVLNCLLRFYQVLYWFVLLIHQFSLSCNISSRTSRDLSRPASVASDQRELKLRTEREQYCTLPRVDSNELYYVVVSNNTELSIFASILYSCAIQSCCSVQFTTKKNRDHMKKLGKARW